ncbi:mitochondrial ribosomal protein L45 [Nomia melanderi]|uniref:mitochondrial ribosomal protein L45 n=1 Tax=Nomia melanderi TaxID=2448451 RepID=UPI0013046F54|nr:probable 39S ribosomal protein L45, mitochondrial [Nomia melanderi]XP_031834152.1 probable 39S ribosomal protein L45, mitochondrial [Nomia melanderi]XP_031834153.1 probable 39S ribosomal protein L45, mitochondrial [Nomia melanderi]XP_031834154.1 probable 39S ribosomal protein L45, mitochondrial [Nomia melanderi]
MMYKYKSAICIFGKFMQNNLPCMLSPIDYPYNNTQQIRNIRKHWNPKFRKERREKFIKVELPKIHERDDVISKEEIRSELKRCGLLPQRTWRERPIYFGCTNNIFEPYVVPEGDGRFSTITKEGAKQKLELVEKKGKSYRAIRKIISYDENFSKSTFPEEALKIYKEAHTALAAKDQDKLLQYVTEAAYPKMIHNIEDKTIIWKFLESLEPARIVYARCTDVIKKHNIYAQVTVRFHTQQILCIYDRFGRLLKGSEILRKDVLDYIVFEKHLSNQYGTWRLHGKIIPSWLPPEEIATKTYTLPKTDNAVVASEQPEESIVVTPDSKTEMKSDTTS